MLVLSNGYVEEIFSCYEEIIDYIGMKDFEAALSGKHSQYTITYIPIT
tara:strand:- start:71 stop:214 length:144 start_codon:yes stop_codon:yes gene_type:complete